MDYLERLKQRLEHEKKNEEYVKLCVEYAKKLIDSNLPVIFDTKHFSLLLGIEPKDLYILTVVSEEYNYKKVFIPKKRGGKREINIPSAVLKYVQRWILDNILANMHYSEHSMGFKTGTSIVKNAIPHLNKKCVLNLDIQDFFPSITYDDVFAIFAYYGYTRELATLFAKICTYDGVLPQGAPTSPALANLRCLKLDKRVSTYCDTFGGEYTRYADDITISSNKDLKRIKQKVIRIIEDEGFLINEDKTRIRYQHQKQQVTGLIVNSNSLTIPKHYKRRLQQEIYYCKKYGVANHQNHIGDGHAFYKEHLYGKAYFIKMVEPDVGARFLEELDDIEWEY